MHKIVYLVLGVVAVAGATAAGCGGGDTGSGGAGPGGGNPGSGGTGPGSGGNSGSGGSTATSTASNSGGGGGGQALSCDAYCTEVLTNCTTGDNDSQYPDLGSDGQHPRDICLAVCASFPVGTPADMSGDTLGCRFYHGGATPHTTHCWHSGPTGGDADNTTSGEGLCGDGCEAFCNLEAVACTGANEQYATNAECITACQAFPAPANTDTYDAVSAAGRHDFFCYMYHLNAAAVDPGTHCVHTKAGASPCDPPGG